MKPAPRPPVRDWATDFDHLDPNWVENPFPIWDELRRRCPIAHSERYGGVYLPTRYDDIWRIANDTEHFSSRQIMVRDALLLKLAPMPPITSDPPYHRPARMILMSAFAPAMARRLEPIADQICGSLLASLEDAPTCDAASDYAYPLCLRVISRVLGVPEEDARLFGRWAHDIMVAGITDARAAARAIDAMTVYFASQVARRAANLGDDLVSYLLRIRLDGRPVPHDHLVATLRLLALAGVDTPASVLGASLWHLARCDDDRRLLRASPDLLDAAVEELLRAYAPATMARQVVKATEIRGCPFEPGQMVLLAFPAANRDPEMFRTPDRIVLDRARNRHVAFGAGIHRCLGRHLARLLIGTGLRHWLQAFPDFHLDPAGRVEWTEGTVRGPRCLPLVLGA